MPTPRMIPRMLLRAPAEPLRCEMQDAPMEDLVASIKELGILEPLLVSPIYEDAGGDEILTPDPHLGQTGVEPTAYEIIDGHRRSLAAQIAGVEEVPVMVFENPEQARYAIMLHANVCREDVTPYEEGVQFLDLATKFAWSMDQLTRFFRKSEDYINDRIDCVRKDAAVAEALRDRRINLGQAREILKCQDGTFRPALLEQAAVHGATIQSLRVMRHNRESEERAAQGNLPMHASAQFVEGGIFPEETCLWCGNVPPLGDARKVTVCAYHQKDLEAVLDKVSLRAFIAAKAAGPA